MGATYLEDIVAHHRARAARDERPWRDRVDAVRTRGPSFAAALRAGDTVAVIAEVKRRSPSKGWIDRDLDPSALASAYERGGAAAVSVLTDAEFFAGTLRDLANVRAATALPVLRKDFTLGANDVVDAAEMGASAVLLIVAALSDVELRLYLDVAAQVDLDALVEVHDEVEAHRALDAGATLVGVNQRDLHTFEVDVQRAARVAAVLPAHIVAVAESGLASRDDVAAAAAAGVDAVLIGETLVRASNPEERVRELCGVARVARA
ncbi:MAG: indole-3-glycerol phosphate synthase TrpC [Acidimicrobiales bacterium]